MTQTLIRPSAVSTTPDGEAPGVPRDRWKRPLIHVAGRPKLVPYTRCTTYVDCIEDKSNLASWGKRMVLVGAAKAPPLVAQAGRLNPEDAVEKKRLNGIAEQLVAIAGANDKREKGTYLHGLTEYADRGEPLPPCTPSDLADIGAYMSATVMLEVTHIERLVVVDELAVAGTPDRVSYYDGPGPDGAPLAGNLITDLKTGSVEYGALKMAMQLAVYSRGLFYDHVTQARHPMPDVNQDWGLIVHLPAGSGPCTVYWIDLATGWRAVQVAAQIRALRKEKVTQPFRLGPSDNIANMVAPVAHGV